MTVLTRLGPALARGPARPHAHPVAQDARRGGGRARRCGPSRLCVSCLAFGLGLLKRDFVICQIGCRFLVIPIEFHKGKYTTNFEAC